MIVVDVPRTVPRATYVALIEGLGFSVQDVVSMELGQTGFYVTVQVRDANGTVLLDATEPHAVARHRVYVQVLDEWQEPTS